jgi:hypothetical protein
LRQHEDTTLLSLYSLRRPHISVFFLESKRAPQALSAAVSRRISSADRGLMSSHFKKLLSQRKPSSPPTSQPTGLASAATPPTTPREGSPRLPNPTLPTTFPNPNDSQTSTSRGQQLPSADYSMQNPNQLGRPPAYTYALPGQLVDATPPMGGRPHTPVPSPPINTQQPAPYSPQHIRGAPPQDSPGTLNYTRPQYSPQPGAYQATAPYRPRGILEADAGAKKKTRLIVGIDFVCPV